MWLVTASKKGISSYQMARSLGVTQKTAWFMDHRLRLAMRTESFNIPFNVAIVPSRVGTRVSVLTGFNMRRR